MNSNLYNKTIELPKEVLEYLQTCFEYVPNSDPSIEGHKRNEELRNSGYVTYQQLGRIKNWFDTYSGTKDSKEYQLNGGDKMKKWVNDILNQMRSGDKTSKEFRKEYLPDKTTSNDLKTNISNDNRPTQSHKTGLGKYGIDLSESVKRINEIMKKII